MAREVVCVTTDANSPYDDCRCIETIGYEISGSSVFERTPEHIHDKIVNENAEFYVEHRGSKTYLEAAEKANTKYVRTQQNDTKEDNLLQQSSC